MNHDKETLEAAETYAKKNAVLIGKREVFTVDMHLGNPQQFENIYELNKEVYWAFLAGVAYAREKQGKEIVNLKEQLKIARGTLERLEAGFAGMFGHQSVSPQQDFYDRGEQFVNEALKKLKELEEL